MFAEAARQSREQGFGGFVFFQAKSNLIPHYQEMLGAKLISQRDRIMSIDEAAAKLIKQYYGGE